MVTETEADRCVCQVQENRFQEEIYMGTDKMNQDIPGTKHLFPMEPLEIIGGKISRKSESADSQKISLKILLQCY